MDHIWFVLVVLFQVGMLALLGWIVYAEWRDRQANAAEPKNDHNPQDPPAAK